MSSMVILYHSITIDVDWLLVACFCVAEGLLLSKKGADRHVSASTCFLHVETQYKKIFSKWNWSENFSHSGSSDFGLARLGKFSTLGNQFFMTSH
jgi:hypothetical protein